MSDVIAQIDAEIAKLRQARALLAGAPEQTKRKPGRPSGSKNSPKPVQTVTAQGKRRLSPEGRTAIAEAMKRRWAAKRTQTSK